MFKVRMVPVQPHCFLYGGFDIQMSRTLDVLRAIGVDAKPLDYWDRSNDFDVLHVWGFEYQHENLLRIAKDYEKKIVVSPLLPYITPWRVTQEYVGLNYRAKRIAKYIDKLIVVNELQANTAVRLYGFNPKSVEIVPTMIDPIFFQNETTHISKAAEKYLICIGNILPRKNQLNLAKAALMANCSIIFVGRILGGHEDYAEQFQSEIIKSNKIAWYKDIDWGQLFNLIKNSSGVAVPSFEECQPASALEAIALGKPIMMANRPYAFQKIFHGALIINPKSISGMAKGLIQILEDGNKFIIKNKMIEGCKVEKVSSHLEKIYFNLVKQR